MKIPIKDSTLTDRPANTQPYRQGKLFAERPLSLVLDRPGSGKTV